MKRLIYISLLCIQPILFGMDALWIDEEDSVTLSSFTQSIQQRYYFVARLNAVHDLIESLHCSCLVSYHDYQALSHLQPHHPRIIRCVDDIQQEQTCKPLLHLWDELCSYKYVNDEQLIKEYTTLVCIIAQQLVAFLGEKLSSEDKKTLASLVNKSPTDIHSYDITFRYYIIKRLKKAKTLLAASTTLSIQAPLLHHLSSSTNQRILQCAQDIQLHGHLQPLIQLFEDLEQFQSVDDVTFIHELLVLILLVEQQVLASVYLPRQKELYAQLEHDIKELSIEELLKSIDILTAHIEPYALTKNQHAHIYSSLKTLATFMSMVLCAWYASQKLGVFA